MENSNFVMNLLTINGAVEGNCRITYHRNKDDKKPLTLVFQNGKAVKAENLTCDLLFDKNYQIFNQYKPIEDKFSIRDLARLRQCFGIKAIRSFMEKNMGITSVRFDGNAGIENIEINGAKIHIDFETEAERNNNIVSAKYKRTNPKNVKDLKPSSNAIKMIKENEQCILYAYDDLGETMIDPKTKKEVPKPYKKGTELKGTLTIGYGHTGPDVKPGMRITQKKAEELLQKDIKIATDALKKNIKVPLTQNEFDALTSFTFNIGENHFKKSTMLTLLNKEKYSAASNEFGRWVKSGGETLRGLKIRRKKERQLFRQA